MSIMFHKTLNPKLWDKNNRIHFEVALKLKEIAEAFIEFMGINKDAVKDVVVTGSSASYNYTPHSDIDLHILVDVDKIHKDCPIVNEFLISKKSEFNSKHDIFIYGIPVEVYAEDYRNENVHNGLYSLKKNKWIDEPKRLEPVDNDIAVEAKYKEMKEAANEVADKDEVVKLIDKIKKMRRAGLAKNGEFSVENLVFKRLRNEGIIDKLMQVKKEGIDKELSLEESLKRVYEGLIDSTIVLLEDDRVSPTTDFISGKLEKVCSENVQLLQGLRDSLEKVYNKDKVLGGLCGELVNTLEEMMAMNTGISGMMDIQPTPIAGRRQPSYKKQGKKREKAAMYKYPYLKTRS